MARLCQRPSSALRKIAMSYIGVFSWNDTSRVSDALLSILLAARCAACEEVLDEPTRGPVCAHCWTTVRTITPPVCHTCGDPLPSWRVISRHASACPRCRRAPRAVTRSRAVGPYETTLRAIIHALKYNGRRSLALPLAALMRSHGQDVLGDADCVVPVPLHPGRRRARGFNQAADLAAHLGLPVTPALRRVKRTPTQTGLPAAHRRRNLRGAFALAPSRWGRWRVLVDVRRQIEGRCVVLVDDVTTTGATLDACARVLRHSGAREVRALTAARVVTRPR